MLRLKNRQRIPPVGWTYEESGVRFRAGSFESLVIMVNNYYGANQIKPPECGTAARIEDWIATRSPAIYSVGAPLRQGPVRPVWTSGRVNERTQAAMRAARNRPSVDVGTGAQRVQVCSACPMRAVMGCTNCTGVMDWIVGHRGPPARMFEQSGLCAAAGVIIAGIATATIWVNDLNWEAPQPGGCWIQKEKAP
jgi:hypothetical protein